MYVDPNKTFLRNKAVRVVFGLGMAFVVASIIVNSIYFANISDCIIYDYCSGYSYHYYSCYSSGYVYCCDPSSSSYSSYTCGGYTDCYWGGSDYSRCVNYGVTQWILAIGAIACLIILIILQKQHKQRVVMAAAQNINAGNQVVFSDERGGANYPNYNNQSINRPGVVVE
jgi:hypothetical protein